MPIQAVADRVDDPVAGLRHLAPAARPGGIRVGLVPAGSRTAAVDSVIRLGLAEAGHETVELTPRLRTGRSAARLADIDVVIMQLDCGRGADRLPRVDLAPPTIAVLHGFPSHPSLPLRKRLAQVLRDVRLVVVMSQAARAWLLSRCAVDEDRVICIPWGSEQIRAPRGEGMRVVARGAFTPGLGAEHLVEAVGLLRARGLDVRCAILSEGPCASVEYTQRLQRLVAAHGVHDLVDIAGPGQGDRRVEAAGVAVLPYESELVLSPTLIDTLAAGTPVIAADFPHARELLADGAGIIVPSRNARALAGAIQVVATDPVVLEAMTSRARLLAPSMSWRRAQREFARQCVAVSRATGRQVA